jgi:hypothetical protein
MNEDHPWRPMMKTPADPITIGTVLNNISRTAEVLMVNDFHIPVKRQPCRFSVNEERHHIRI